MKEPSEDPDSPALRAQGPLPLQASPQAAERARRSEAKADAEPSRPREEQDTRDRDDPERLDEEARQQVERTAAELRKAKVPIGTEPPSVYRP